MRAKRGVTPMVPRAKPIKKAKKTGVKSGNGRGVWRKKVTFLWGSERKSGGDNPFTPYI